MNLDNRLALVTFGSQAFIQFHLDAYKSIDNMQMAIDYMWTSTGHGSLANAIKYTIEQGFEVGNRQNAPDVIIVFSLTSDMNVSQSAYISDLLQQHMIEMVLLSSRNNNFGTMLNTHLLPEPENRTLQNDAESVMSIICKGDVLSHF